MSKLLCRAMDHEELDKQYNARAVVPDIQPFLDRYLKLSIDARFGASYMLQYRR